MWAVKSALQRIRRRKGTVQHGQEVQWACAFTKSNLQLTLMQSLVRATLHTNITLGIIHKQKIAPEQQAV